MSTPRLLDRLRNPRPADVVSVTFTGHPHAVTAVARALASVACVTAMRHQVQGDELIRLRRHLPPAPAPGWGWPVNTPNTVKATLTRRRERAVVENFDYAAFVRRIVAAYGRRVGGGDIEALPDMLAISRDLDTGICAAVAGLRRTGYSWTEIADRLGITRQAAHQRWGDTT